MHNVYLSRNLFNLSKLSFNIKYIRDPRELFYTPSEDFTLENKYHVSEPIKFHSKHMHIETPKMTIDVASIMSSNWFEEDTHNTDLPFLPQEILKLMHNFGYSMLLDDKHDIGKLAYPGHASGLHHWYIGAGLMVLAQLGGMLQKLKEFMEVGSELSLPGISEEPPLVATRVPSAALQNRANRALPDGIIPYVRRGNRTPSLPHVQPMLPETTSISQNNIQTQPRPQQLLKSTQIPNPLHNILK